MTALEYMEKQLHKHRLNYDKELARGATEEMLYNIAMKCTYYKSAAEALRSVNNGLYAEKQVSER